MQRYVLQWQLQCHLIGGIKWRSTGRTSTTVLTKPRKLGKGNSEMSMLNSSFFITRSVHRYHLKCIYQEMDIQVFYLKSNGQLINRCNAIPVKIPAHFFFAKISMLTLRFIWRFKGPRTAKKNLEREEHRWGTYASVLKTYYKAIIIKTVLLV